MLHLLLGAALGAFTETFCNVAARIVSSFFNFNVNNSLVFRNSGPYGRALLRYYCLAVPQLAVSTLLIALFVHLLKTETAQQATVIKVIVDGCLFIASFFIQKFWVFSQKDSTASDDLAENNKGSSDRKEKHHDL